jgi:hypothetical protein
VPENPEGHGVPGFFLLGVPCFQGFSSWESDFQSKALSFWILLVETLYRFSTRVESGWPRLSIGMLSFVHQSFEWD